MLLVHEVLTTTWPNGQTKNERMNIYSKKISSGPLKIQNENQKVLIQFHKIFLLELLDN